jgi:hypothetical protein
MILQTFNVTSRGNRYRFMDRQAIDSDAEREAIQQVMGIQLGAMQEDAMCAALGIAEVGAIGNLGFGVYDDRDDTLVGVFLVASLAYQSGPWADLVDWEVVNANAPAVFHARPMPGFPVLPLDDSLDLSTDGAHHLLARRLTSVGGIGVEFRRLSWAIFKDRTDSNSRAAKRIHAAAAADNRFSMSENADPNDAALTRVDIELA